VKKHKYQGGVDCGCSGELLLKLFTVKLQLSGKVLNIEYIKQLAPKLMLYE